MGMLVACQSRTASGFGIVLPNATASLPVPPAIKILPFTRYYQYVPIDGMTSSSSSAKAFLKFDGYVGLLPAVVTPLSGSCTSSRNYVTLTVRNLLSALVKGTLYKVIGSRTLGHHILRVRPPRVVSWRLSCELIAMMMGHAQNLCPPEGTSRMFVELSIGAWRCVGGGQFIWTVLFIQSITAIGSHPPCLCNPKAVRRMFAEATNVGVGQGESESVKKSGTILGSRTPHHCIFLRRMCQVQRLKGGRSFGDFLGQSLYSTRHHTAVGDFLWSSKFERRLTFWIETTFSLSQNGIATLSDAPISS
ncbi:hypothetical protein BU15DRAFT_67762 [Melanogaster broomeanus]|nr:hypothetical protein BU15DRAFT_67762 [Melanogaster broomeanus]